MGVLNNSKHGHFQGIDAMRAHILTPWVGKGTVDDPFMPMLAKDYPSVKYSDITGQDAKNLTPTINVFLSEIECSEILISALDNDPNYKIIWTESKNTNENLTNEELNDIKAALKMFGASQSEIDIAFGISAGGRKVERLHEQLKTWLRGNKK